MQGAMQVWVLVETLKQSVPLAVCLTAISEDKIFNDRSLYIFSFYGIKPLNDEMYAELYETLARFGRFQNCRTISASTDSKAVLAQAKRLGAETFKTFFAKEI